MKVISVGVFLMILSLLVAAARADSTISLVHRHAYAANAGWVNARTDVTNGAVIGQFHCSGYLYGANVGWISLGDGSPADGHAYGNASAGDFGVNIEGGSRLRGYAWGANVGWIRFEAMGDPRVDLHTGDLSGYAWGANIGWIGLANAEARVRTICLDPGPDAEPDGLPDAWEWGYTNRLIVLRGGSADFDGDGATDTDEYGADTNPLDPDDRLRIVSVRVADDTNRVIWTCKPTRLYRLEATNRLVGAGTWVDVGSGLLDPPPISLMGLELGGVTESNRFYRVQSVLPLAP